MTGVKDVKGDQERISCGQWCIRSKGSDEKDCESRTHDPGLVIIMQATAEEGKYAD